MRNLSIALLVSQHHEHHKQAAEWFGAGLRRHGLNFEVADYHALPDCDLAVFWAHRPPIIQHQRDAGRHYLCLERGFVGDRMHWISAGLNGLNGRATWLDCQDDGNRWRLYHGHHLRDWREGGEYAVIMGQVPGDAALNGISYQRWLNKTSEQLFEAGYEVRFRPHPLAPGSYAPAPIIEGELYEVLDRAAVVATLNSTSGVDAALYGVPVIAFDEGSMAWDVASRALPPVRPDRAAWAHRLAWAQWSPGEIANGVAWSYLRELIEENL